VGDSNTITIRLPAPAVADLAAMGRACGMDGPELAASMLSLWIGHRITAVRSASSTADPERRRDVAARRFAVLHQWMKAGRPQGRTYRGQSRATLYLWERRWQAGGLAGLMDGRADPKRAKETPSQRAAAFLADVRRRFIAQPRTSRRSIAAAYRAALAGAQAKGWPTVSQREAHRFVRAPESKGEQDAIEGASTPLQTAKQNKARRRA
jgi:hypothetical protein